MALPTTNLVARYIAGQGLTTSSGRISKWNDQSGNGHHATQNNEAIQPYDTTDSQGRPVVRFPNVTNCWLEIPTTLSLNTRSFSAWAVRTSPGGSNLFSIGNNGTGFASGLLRNYKANGTSSGDYGVFASGSRLSTFPHILNRELHGAVGGATTATVHWAGGSASSGAQTNATHTGAEIARLANGGSSYWHGDIYEIAIYNSEQSASDVDALKAYYRDTYSLTETWTQQIVFEGDSITAGTGINDTRTYPMQVCAQVDGWRMHTVAIGGATVSALTNRVASTDSLLDFDLTRNVLMVLIGRNDLSSATAAEFYSNLVAYVRDRSNAGWEVWVGTCIATGSSIQPKIDEANQRIRGTNGYSGIVTDAGATKVIDFGGDPVFDTSDDSNNLSYYQGDATHPNVSGAAVMAGILTPQLLGISEVATGGISCGGTAASSGLPVGYRLNPIIKFRVNLQPIQNNMTLGPITNERTTGVPVLLDLTDLTEITIPGVNQRLRHGDEFILEGQLASRTLRNHSNGIEGDYTSTPLVVVKRF